MHAIAAELENIINKYSVALFSLEEENLTYKSSPAKWSKKELIGHLIDSASANIRRFVVGQYEENPHIVYNQDKWVAIAGYQQWKSAELVELWVLLNKQAAIILANTSPEMAERKVQTEEQHTIEWLASDYLKHLRYHLHQILDLEPAPYR